MVRVGIVAQGNRMNANVVDSQNSRSQSTIYKGAVHNGLISDHLISTIFKIIVAH